ncbi:hypothetical protein EDD15DRAFT_2292319 [Pisolithus albus]|nr:hypothetical protein EDD15DRAFT_2292319 [Pisolithus albus]
MECALNLRKWLSQSRLLSFRCLLHLSPATSPSGSFLHGCSPEFVTASDFRRWEFKRGKRTCLPGLLWTEHCINKCEHRANHSSRGLTLHLFPYRHSECDRNVASLWRPQHTCDTAIGRAEGQAMNKRLPTVAKELSNSHFRYGNLTCMLPNRCLSFGASMSTKTFL